MSKQSDLLNLTDAISVSGTNVGIGVTSSPVSPNDATTFLHIGNATNQDTSIVLQDAVETWEIYQNDDLSFLFDTTNVMTLQRLTGNVGIGTTLPQGKVHIANPNGSGNVPTSVTAPNSYLQIGSGEYDPSNNGKFMIAFGYTAGTAQNAPAYIGYEEASTSGFTNGNLTFYTRPSPTDIAPTKRMTIDPSGAVYIGKTTESATTAGWQFKPSGEAIVGRVANDDIFVFQNSSSGGTVGRISITGSSTSYNTSSDYRLKTDAQPMVGASDRVLALKPVNFEWIASGERVDGFLAHEAQAVVPECVTGTKDAVDEDGNAIMQGIDQSKLVPLLTAALQEALTEISALKVRVAALEAN